MLANLQGSSYHGMCLIPYYCKGAVCLQGDDPDRSQISQMMTDCTCRTRPTEIEIVEAAYRDSVVIQIDTSRPVNMDTMLESIHNEMGIPAVRH